MGNGNVNSDYQLVKAFINQDDDGFSLLFDRYKDDVYTYSLSLLKREDFAEEIVQEVFMKIWLYRDRLDVNQNFKSFLFTLTRNFTFNFMKKAAGDRKLREEVFSLNTEEFSPIETAIQEEAMESIKREALDLLPPRRREIFQMSRFDGKSYQEISQELGISLSTVKSQMSKALETMRDFMNLHRDITISLVFVMMYL